MWRRNHKIDEGQFRPLRDQKGPFVDPDVVAGPAHSGLLARLFGRGNRPQMVMLAPDDARHPCFLKDGVASVESSVQWLGFRIDEHMGTRTRLCCWTVDLVGRMSTG